MMINLTKPFYIAPVHGEPRHQHLYNTIADSMGFPEHRRFMMTAGVPLVFDDTQAYLGEPVPAGRILVDNSGTPGVTDEVLRDRYTVANDGLIVITIAVDVEQGEIVNEPIIQARGLHTDQSLLEQIQAMVDDHLRAMARDDIRDVTKVRREIADLVRRAAQKRAQIRPLVLPVIVEI